MDLDMLRAAYHEIIESNGDCHEEADAAMPLIQALEERNARLDQAISKYVDDDVRYMQKIERMEGAAKELRSLAIRAGDALERNLSGLPVRDADEIILAISLLKGKR